VDAALAAPEPGHAPPPISRRIPSMIPITLTSKAPLPHAVAGDYRPSVGIHGFVRVNSDAGRVNLETKAGILSAARILIANDGSPQGDARHRLSRLRIPVHRVGASGRRDCRGPVAGHRKCVRGIGVGIYVESQVYRVWISEAGVMARGAELRIGKSAWAQDRERPASR
jgi:hypothetical protein